MRIGRKFAPSTDIQNLLKCQSINLALIGKIYSARFVNLPHRRSCKNTLRFIKVRVNLTYRDAKSRCLEKLQAKRCKCRFLNLTSQNTLEPCRSAAALFYQSLFLIRYLSFINFICSKSKQHCNQPARKQHKAS